MPLSVILQTLNSRDLSFTLTSGTGSLCNLQQFSSILFNKQWANEWMNSSNPIVHTGYQRYLMHSPYPQKEEGVKNKCMCACSVDSLWSHELRPTKLLCPWDFPGKNTGVGCHFLLQGIFPAQRSDPHLLYLLHWQAGSLLLSHVGSLKKQEVDTITYIGT